MGNGVYVIIVFDCPNASVPFKAYKSHVSLRLKERRDGLPSNRKRTGGTTVGGLCILHSVSEAERITTENECDCGAML